MAGGKSRGARHIVAYRKGIGPGGRRNRTENGQLRPARSGGRPLLFRLLHDREALFLKVAHHRDATDDAEQSRVEDGKEETGWACLSRKSDDHMGSWCVHLGLYGRLTIFNCAPIPSRTRVYGTQFNLWDILQREVGHRGNLRDLNVPFDARLHRPDQSGSGHHSDQRGTIRLQSTEERNM